ncbi:MAG TPA: glycosyltransferase family 9 protein [Gemmatimonadaceae bacterium]|nr:glycosyltransferase family 9 protein [Gemmatimonadaceae bacterium]
MALPAPAEPLSGADRGARSRDRSIQYSLIIQTAFIGDTILTTPLIAELATRGPVDIVTTPVSATLLQNNPSLRRVFVFDKRKAQRGIGGLWAMARTIRRHRAEHDANVQRTVAYLAQSSARSAALAVLAGAHERVGFATSPARSMYTKRVPYIENQHHAARLWRLAFPNEAKAEPRAERLRPRLFPGSPEKAAVDALLREHGLSGPFVALAPGSVWATKRWPYYPELARRISERVPVVVIGGKEDQPQADAIAAVVAPDRFVSAVGRLSLLGSAELIGRATAIVSNDSSPTHLASAMGTATISIFGPTVPDFGFGPLAPRSATLGHAGLACRPCDRHGPRKCPLGHWRCMKELAVEEVERLVLALALEKR